MDSAMFVVGSIGPGIEKDLIEGRHFDVYRYMQYLVRVAPKLRHIFVGYIPLEMVPYFSCDKFLRIVKEAIETDSQSNILFAPSAKQCPAARFALDGVDVSGWAASKMLSTFFMAGRFPVALQMCNSAVFKLDCEECTHGNPCVSLETVPILCDKKIDELIDIVDEAAKREIALLEIDVSNVSVDSIRRMARLMALIYRVDGMWDGFDTSIIVPGFDEDLRKAHEPFRNIAFSMFRALVFKGARRENRDKFSIDVHANSPKKYDDVDLLRSDVLGVDRTGAHSHSGANRLLIGRYRGVHAFVAYTEDHDFSSNVIEGRIPVVKKLIDDFLKKKES